MKPNLKTVWKKAEKLDTKAWNIIVDELREFQKQFQDEVSAFRGWLRVYRGELSNRALADYEDHLKKLEALGETDK